MGFESTPEKNKFRTFPKYIELQTKSQCNGHCTTCPYTEMEKKFQHVTMTSDEIEKIICECDLHKEALDRIIPYLNNEPTLDKRFIETLRRLKKSGHFVEISTNASGLTEENIEIIVKERLIDDFRISFFGGTQELYSQLMPGLNFYINVSKIRRFLEVNEFYGNPIDLELIAILCPWIDMKENLKAIELLFPKTKVHLFGFLDRAGNVCGHRNEKRLSKFTRFNNNPLNGCELQRPFERMNILANGDAIICSQDWGREVIIGNVLKTSIEEVWNSDRAKQIRLYVTGETNDIPENFICTRCKAAVLKSDNSGEILKNFKGDCYMSENGIKLLKQQKID